MNERLSKYRHSSKGIVGLLLALIGVARRDEIDLQTGFDPNDVRLALDKQLRAATGRVPAEVMAKLLSIRQIILGILPSSGNLPLGSLDLFVVERTATDYLPRSLESYLSLPRTYATLHRLPNGQTPKEVLLDQLSLLETKMKEVAEDVHRNDADRLLIHGRFLEDRFGRPRLSLEPPATDQQ